MAGLKEPGNFTDNISHYIQQNRFQQCLKGFMSDVTIGNRKERIKHRMLELFKQLNISFYTLVEGFICMMISF